MMVDRPISLDEHRGMSAQKATKLRRECAEVEASQADRLRHQHELEDNLLAAPASHWAEAVAKARYLLTQYAHTPGGIDPRQMRLIDNVLADFDRLLRPSTQSSCSINADE